MANAAQAITPQNVAEGDSAPDFTLPTDNGSLCLSDYRGKKNVLVFFYPKDDTPGCTKQACAVRDLQAEFDAADTVVIGISKDSEASHGKFRSKYSLTHFIATDADNEVAAAYGAWGEKMNYGKKYMGLIRSMFLVDKNGTLVRCWRNVKADGSIERALEAAKKLA